MENTQKTLTLEGRAKINLTLDVTGRRPDGYHTVEMVMQTVALCDYITLTTTGTNEISMTCDCADLATDESNLAIRAARIFCEETGLQNSGVQIALQKRIPMQAGLAGGSTDAAAVLCGMNQLFETNCSIEKLCAMGAKLGADVPYCIRGGTMFAEGIGELLTPLPALPKCTVLICKPPVGVPTPDIYRAIDAVPIEKHPQTEAVCTALTAGDLSAVASLLYNVMEPVTATRHPVITEIHNILLEHGALGACMSGSGSAVFGLYRDADAANEAYQLLSARFDDVFLTEIV